VYTVARNVVAALSREHGPQHAGRDGASSRPVVLHVCTRYQRGGSERRIRDSMRALPEFRHHLVVGADSDVALAREQTGAERVWALPTLVRHLDPRRDLVSLVSLWRLLRRSDYAVVVSHQSKAGVLTRAAAAAGGPPAVHSLSMASFGAGYGRAENWVFRRVERGLGRRTAAFCVVGADLAARFAAVGVPGDRLHVVRSGVPLPARLRPREEARRLLDERFGTTPGRPVICYVGSLEPRKNPLLLPHLLRRLHDHLADAPDLLVVGDGPQRDALVTELGSVGLTDHAVLTGHLTDPELVHDAIRGADVLVLLSEAEGLPQVLVQAAAAGTPYVAFDVEGVREVLALGARGSAVELGRLDGVVAAVAHWLATRSQDRDPVADLTSWSPDRIAAAYRAVVHRVLPVPAQPLTSVG
jgi:glycosyltransferase involved in cell wall biosynthesis